LIFTYAGTNYEAYDIEIFTNAISRLIRNNSIPGGNISINLLGNFLDYKRTADSAVGNLIHSTAEFINHIDSVSYIVNSHVLLLILNKMVGSTVYTTKVFEYLYSGNDILCVCPRDCEVINLVKKARSWTVLDIRDSVGLTNAIMKIYQNWERGYYNDRELNDISCYNVKNIVREFSKELNALLGD